MSPIQSTTGPSSMAELKKVLPELSHPDGAPVRVLVVDDEPMIADLLSMGFTLCGWEVIVAHDGATAAELGTAGRPDLAILDVMLPDMDGLDVLDRLRAHWSEMPAMFLTAKDATEDRVAGLPGRRTRRPAFHRMWNAWKRSRPQYRPHGPRSNRDAVRLSRTRGPARAAGTPRGVWP